MNGRANFVYRLSHYGLLADFCRDLNDDELMLETLKLLDAMLHEDPAAEFVFPIEHDDTWALFFDMVNAEFERLYDSISKQDVESVERALELIRLVFEIILKGSVREIRHQSDNTKRCVQMCLKHMEVLHKCFPKKSLRTDQVTALEQCMFGIKGDLVRILGNVTFDNTIAQHEVRTWRTLWIH